MIHQGTSIAILALIIVMSVQISQAAPYPKDTVGLPFLDISNGRVGVNFGGYHAEAGLGGVLGNSAAGGGLYAGAGTPFGPHASAGLGGVVNGGNPDYTGGLLQARAGLGNGGPEAAAGLGGNLDDADPSRNRGVLWKSTSRGDTAQITSKSLTADDGNIQKIPATKTTQLRIGSVGPSDSNTQFIRRDVSSEQEKLNVVEPVAVTQSPAVYYSPTRRCQRKRLCRGFRTTLVQQQVPLTEIPADFSAGKLIPSFAAPPADAPAAVASDSEISVAPGPAPQIPTVHPRPRTTIFDDIFNIPISTLAAVNQLLNNKVG